jgi:KipI family sensor histidine kinase inhibitor
MSPLRVDPLGDAALLIQLGYRIDVELNARAIAIAATLRRAALPGVIDVAPAYASVCVRYDPLAWFDARDARAPYERIAERIGTFVQAQVVSCTQSLSPDTGGQVCIEVPVCYAGDFGPDLDAVARHAGLDADAVVGRHSGAEYRVAMLGFAPGFAYLLGLDAALHTPRRATPRTRVPAGSVAIGGAQTGIYPRELPGGWQIIGRTPLTLFDPARDPPAALAPGQHVRFRAIDAHEFAALAK